MVTPDLIIYEYEQVLLGNPYKTIFQGTLLSEKRKVGGVIIRYAIEHLLHWDPNYALTELNKDVEDSLGLRDVYRTMKIDCSENNYFNRKEVLQYAFPEKIKYSLQEEAINEYKRKMKIDEYQFDTSAAKFHKNFFKGYEGSERASAILNYAIRNFLGNINTYDLYHFFGNRKCAVKWMEENGIEVDSFPGYDTPLDLLHYSLRGDDVSDLMYLNEYLGAKVLPDEYEREYQEWKKKEKEVLKSRHRQERREP